MFMCLINVRPKCQIQPYNAEVTLCWKCIGFTCLLFSMWSSPLSLIRRHISVWLMACSVMHMKHGVCSLNGKRLYHATLFLDYLTAPSATLHNLQYSGSVHSPASISVHVFFKHAAISSEQGRLFVFRGGWSANQIRINLWTMASGQISSFMGLNYNLLEKQSNEWYNLNNLQWRARAAYIITFLTKG